MAINLLSFTNITGELILSSSNTNILVIQGNSGLITGVGNVTINWTGYSGVFYNTGQENFSISKKILNVIPNSYTRAEGQSNPAFGYSINGFVYGQNSGVLSSIPSFGTTATSGSPTGIYTITVQSSGSGINYNFNYGTGYLTIIQDPSNYITNYDVNWEIIYG